MDGTSPSFSPSPDVWCDPLQVLPPDKYTQLLQQLRKQVPSSLKVIGHLNSNMKDAKHFELSAYVDEWPTFSVLLCVVPTAEGIMMYKNDIVFHATDELKLKYVLQNTRVIDWNKSVHFKGVSPLCSLSATRWFV
ncbi:uncharacterized protein LOC144344963 [Saccoglossus kowalevskii]